MKQQHDSKTRFALFSKTSGPSDPRPRGNGAFGGRHRGVFLGRESASADTDLLSNPAASRGALKPSNRFALKAATFLIFACSVLFVATINPTPSLADTAAEIQAKIDEQTAKIAQLEKEIAEYETQLAQVSTQKKTLQSAVNQLDLSRKKISSNISVTESQIKKTTLQIQELSGSIEDKEEHMARNASTVGQALRTVARMDDNTLAEYFLSAKNFTDVWEEVDTFAALGQALQEQSKELAEVKEDLTVDRDAAQKKQNQLTVLKRDLTGQKQVLDQNRKDQAALLSQTKDKESNYQALLKQKQQAKAEFEKQLNEYEAQLKFDLDPTKIPKAGSGVLSFPLDPSYMQRCQGQTKVYGNGYCITQYFGNTSFAQSGAYKGKGHNGIDFGSPQGTKVVAALSGTVQATGNTDAYAGCYSYGKWVLVKHSNGLSTLYSHLSIISVSGGDAVPTGGLLGYSGQTGYATGPHLHFSVYASSAVKVVRYGDVSSKTNCPNATIPVAATEGYLNPMSYL